MDTSPEIPQGSKDTRPRLQPGIEWYINDERVEDTLRSRRLIETPTCYTNRLPRLKSGSIPFSSLRDVVDEICIHSLLPEGSS